jgi:hypothetical protein
MAWSTLLGMFRSMIYPGKPLRLLYRLPARETYRGPDVNAIPDSVDIDVIVMTGVAVERGPVDSLGTRAAAIRLHASGTGEVTHRHRGRRRRGIVQRSHNGHASGHGGYLCHVGNALAACRGAIAHELIRRCKWEPVIDNRIHGVLWAMRPSSGWAGTASGNERVGLLVSRNTHTLVDARHVVNRASHSAERTVTLDRVRRCRVVAQLAERQDQVSAL